MPVKFNAGQLYQLFFVRREKSSQKLNQQQSKIQVDTTFSNEQNFDEIFSCEALATSLSQMPKDE